MHTAEAVQQAILRMCDAHPAWGARKLHRRLQNLGWHHLPVPNTVQAILARHGRIDPVESRKHQPPQSFEHETPNALRQMGFKGYFAVGTELCHPLTVFDDYSCFNLYLQACTNEQGRMVREYLTHTLRRYGLPQRMAVNNGAPWGDTFDSPYMSLVAWLIRMGVNLFSYSRLYHPQTLGKDEAIIARSRPRRSDNRSPISIPRRTISIAGARSTTANVRESLHLQTPATRYVPSTRSKPEQLPPIEIAPGDIVRRVQ